MVGSVGSTGSSSAGELFATALTRVETGTAVSCGGALAAGQVRFTANAGADLAYGRLTLRVVRETLATVAERRSDDPHLHLLDGLSLYGPADAVEHPLPDALHPDAATHALIGERFARYAFGDGGPFARAAG